MKLNKVIILSIFFLFLSKPIYSLLESLPDISKREIKHFQSIAIREILNLIHPSYFQGKMRTRINNFAVLNKYVLSESFQFQKTASNYFGSFYYMEYEIEEYMKSAAQEICYDFINEQTHRIIIESLYAQGFLPTHPKYEWLFKKITQETDTEISILYEQKKAYNDYLNQLPKKIKEIIEKENK